MDDSVLAEGGCANKVENRLPVDGEAGLSVADHHASVDIDPEEVTHVALLWLAVGTLLALTSEHREDMVARRELGHTLADALHDAASKDSLDGDLLIRQLELVLSIDNVHFFNWAAIKIRLQSIESTSLGPTSQPIDMFEGMNNVLVFVSLRRKKRSA